MSGNSYFDKNQNHPKEQQFKTTPTSKQTATWLEYLSSKEFFVIIGSLIGLGIIFVILLFYVFFPLITKYGQTSVVPSVVSDKGTKKYISLDQATEILSDAGFGVEVSDSDYVADLPPLMVTFQEPKAKEITKPGRTIYLRINKRETPKEKLPNIFLDRLDHVRMVLQNYGFEVGRITKVPGDFPDIVMEATHQGRLLKEGSEVPKGAAIDLRVSLGRKPTKVLIPELIGLTLEEADVELRRLGMNYTPLFEPQSGEDEDFKVYRQDPRFKQDSIEQSSVFTIWINSSGPKNDNSSLPEVGNENKIDKSKKKEKNDSH